MYVFINTYQSGKNGSELKMDKKLLFSMFRVKVKMRNSPIFDETVTSNGYFLGKQSISHATIAPMIFVTTKITNTEYLTLKFWCI